MSEANGNYAKRGWKQVAQTTVTGTLVASALALLGNYLLLVSLGLTPLIETLVSAVIVAVAIGTPLSLMLGLKQRELRRSQRELNRAARFDQLTSCLNGSAFSGIVATGRPASERRSGAFLVIEVQHLKSINLQFGHQWGDEALRVIAAAVRSSVRAGDLVGRVGSAEFGVFLPGASEDNAREVGERIRAAVDEVYFAPGEERSALNVSVAGVLFEDQVEFNDIFRAAEQELCGLQRAGSNEIALAHFSASV